MTSRELMSSRTWPELLDPVPSDVSPRNGPEEATEGPAVSHTSGSWQVDHIARPIYTLGFSVLRLHIYFNNVTNLL
jgi:hypothetical protein